jgi:L-threonylcarbamoyladenylate synthase
VTRVLPPTTEGVATAAEILAGGGLVAFPTDTVYGVAVAWDRADRLPALYGLKQRPPEKQIAALVANLDQVRKLGWTIDERAERLADAFWPGALTLVLGGASGPSGPTQGFRAPDHPVTLALIRAAGPLLATSANLSGEPEALDAEDVLAAFAAQQGELDAVVNGGRVPGGEPSTVLDLTGQRARIVRGGPLTTDQLAGIVELG